MGNQVGGFVTRSTEGPVGVGPISPARLFVALLAERGPSSTPVLVFDDTQRENVFGGAIEDAVYGSQHSEGAEALRVFYDKMNQFPVYVLRIVGADAVQAHVELDSAVELVDVQPSLRIDAKGEGAWANTYYVVVATGTQANTRKIQVYDGDPTGAGTLVETIDNVYLSQPYLDRINQSSRYVTLTALDVDDTDDTTIDVTIVGAEIDADDVYTLTLQNPTGTPITAVDVTVVAETAEELVDALIGEFEALTASEIEGLTFVNVEDGADRILRITGSRRALTLTLLVEDSIAADVTVSHASQATTADTRIQRCCEHRSSDARRHRQRQHSRQVLVHASAYSGDTLSRPCQAQLDFLGSTICRTTQANLTR